MLNFIPSVYFWLAVLVVCLLIEACTTQLLTVWFAAGSLGGLAAAALGAGPMVQLALFLVLSFLLLLLLRPMLRNVIRPRQDHTNADRIIDQTAVVIETIDARTGSGQVRLMGQVWSARAVQEDVIIPEGETVVIRTIAGVKAIVEPCTVRQ